MKSNIDQSNDDPAMLVLYLANELSDEQRQATEAKLAASGELRRQLDQLREAHQIIQRELGQLDAKLPKSDIAASSQRKLSRMMQQWQAERARRAALMPSADGRRIRWWMYPAAAALLLIGYIGWWGLQAGGPEVAATLPAQDVPAETVVQDANPTPPVVLDPPRPMYIQYPTETQYDSAGLVSAERELEQLELLRTLTQ